MAPRAPPPHIAPSLKRPKFSTLNAILWPLPTSPSRFSAGTLHVLQQHRRRRRAVQPHLVLFLAAADTPGNARSTMKAVKCSPSTLAKTMKRSAKPPLVIHIFSPFSTKLPSACCAARVLRAERVGARARLAEAVRADDLAGRSARQVLALLRLGAEERRAAGSSRLACAPNVAPNDAARDMLLADDERRDLVELDAAVRLGDVDAEQPELAAALHAAARASAQSFGSSRSSTGSTSLSTKSVDGLRDQPVFLGQPLGREDRRRDRVGSSSHSPPRSRVAGGRSDVVM